MKIGEKEENKNEVRMSTRAEACALKHHQIAMIDFHPFDFDSIWSLFDYALRVLERCDARKKEYIIEIEYVVGQAIETNLVNGEMVTRSFG